MNVLQGLRLVHSGSVTQTNNKLAAINAGAMWDPGVDMSAYAGNDVGSTPHLLVLYDSAGKRMQGFIGANGGGETLGAELITDGSFNNWTGDVLDDWGKANCTYEKEEGAGAYGGVGSSVKITSVVDAGYIHDRSTLVTSQILVKYSFAYKNIAGDICWIQLWDSNNGNNIIPLTNQVSNTLWTTNSYYPTIPVGCSLAHFNLGLASVGEIGWFDIASLKRVTDISTNGIHLHSTRNGTNRNVASIDSAFDLNCAAGYSFNIYACP